ncbi:threonine synthase [Enterococcus eurekensis]|uniref:Threonine synthase n=1 Tax=Enterococcus eurekensis TaxID=1159753 RepID=A0ABV9M1A0_9ENTE
MTILYKSTRNKNNKVSASQAILQGLASDGGLYVPTEMPKLHLNFEELGSKSYQEVAKIILQAFLADFTAEEIQACVDGAYDQKFSDPVIAPVVKKGEDYFLELFHGPTFAFKDLALSILPYLMTTAAKKNQIENEIVILTATSGDTGKAAMAGFADVPGTRIIVFYPENGVSWIQEKQMVTQTGENTHVVAVKGNFDDAQTAVKQMFNNAELKSSLAANNQQFSSANSMNIGRLLPQIVYYVYTYAQLVQQEEIKNGDLINVSVPTGNFGNILAAYYAKQIGVPIDQLICASNTNNVLTDFFKTGEYNRQREFHLTSSPSMDILVSSNLERLIYHLTNDNPTQTKALMDALSIEGKYQITPEMMAKLTNFYAEFATEKEVDQSIAHLFKETHYTMDPHTAVAKNVADKFKAGNHSVNKMVVVSTASPYKFPRTVVESISGGKSESDDFSLVKQLETLTGIPLPKEVQELEMLPVLHQQVVEVSAMQTAVEAILKTK